MKQKNLRKNFIWNSIGSTINAFISLFLMIVVTRINGIEIAGIFTFAYSFACLLQVLITYAGRPYQVTETNKKILDSDFFYSRILTTVLTFIFAIIFISIKNYDMFKRIIIILAVLYRASDGIADCFYAVLQKNELLYKVGKSLFIKGIIGIISFITVDLIFKNIIISLVTLCLINILICIIYDFRNVCNINFKFNRINYETIKQILIKGFSVFAFTILIQYLVSAQKYTIDAYLPNSYQTIYGVILMPATVIVLISQFLVQPYLTMFVDLVKNNDQDKIKALIIKLILYITIFGAFSMLAAYIIGPEVLSLIYGVNFKDYRLPLIIILFGAIMFAISYIFSSIMLVYRYNKQQLYIYCIVSLFAFLESFYFVKKLKIMGASIAYMLSMLILLILYIIAYLFLKKGKSKNESINNNTSL